VLIWCSLFAGIVGGLHVFARNVLHLVMLRFLFGLGAAGVMPSANAIIRGGTQDRNLGKAYGVTTAATSVGWMAGPLAGGMLAASMGLRAPFVLMGAALVLAAVLVSVCVKPPANATRA